MNYILLCMIELEIFLVFVQTPGERTLSVLETYSGVSQHPNAKTPQGNANFYPEVIFRQSEFIYWLDHPSVLSNAGTVSR